MNIKSTLVIALIILVEFVLLAGCSHTPPASVYEPTVVLDYKAGHQSQTFINDDGYKIFGQSWLPAQEPTAIVLVLHGTCMHSGTYSHVGKFLASNGYLVHATDLQGWGQSEGKGAKGYIDSYEEYVQDIRQIVNGFLLKYPDKKIYVIGESLGATVAMYGYLKQTLPFDGFIFSGPGYKPNPKVLGIRAPEFVNKINTTMGKVWGGVFPGFPTLSSDIGIKMVVSDKKMEEQLLNDPYVSHNWLPAAYVRSLVVASNYIDENVEQINLPLFIVHGEKDMLIPPSSSKELVHRASSRDKTIKIYEGIHHATLLEHQRYEILDEILVWLNKRAKNS